MIWRWRALDRARCGDSGAQESEDWEYALVESHCSQGVWMGAEYIQVAQDILKNSEPAWGVEAEKD